ncbi:hypothetical protein ACGFNU_44715 [Spirillospora sp. NPDC048911]|uniref:hypothetical protein n=1 Tax=Spirillospora sp. NPDC048911 TaxID=3364527 RepID=UPI00371F18E1
MAVLAVLVAILVCAAAVGGLLLWRRRRRRASAGAEEWVRRDASVRSWGARTCAHDAGVQVDEAAWAEIVERLRRTSSS